MSCAPLYRTYQVAKAIVFIPPLFLCGIATLSIHRIGTAICTPFDYIVNGNCDATIGEYKQRSKYMQTQAHNFAAYILQ